MSGSDQNKPKQKNQLHPRSKHQGRYDFDQLKMSLPELEAVVGVNKYGDDSIDFADPNAVKLLNQALLKHHYGVEEWNIPEGYLNPPIPGRADYIHYVSDLLGETSNKGFEKGGHIKCMDLGVGASCIYPLIGAKEYDWKFLASDISKEAVQSSNRIVMANKLEDEIDIRLQEKRKDFFTGIIEKTDRIDAVLCNPPFHKSAEDAAKGTRRKVRNLTGKHQANPVLNFGGQNNELWVKGGEKAFVRNMIKQSKRFSKQVLWFTSLVSKESNLKSFTEALKDVKADRVEIVPMGQGNKNSRFIAWTFQNSGEHKKWKSKHWS